MNTTRGKIIEILKAESGVSKAGKDWKKQDFVIETEGQYSKKICMGLFGDKTDMIQSKEVGDLVDVTFEVESREYNGRWFTNVNAQSVNLVQPKLDLPRIPVTDNTIHANGLPTSESITHAEQYKRAVDVETVEETGLPF